MSQNTIKAWTPTTIAFLAGAIATALVPLDPLMTGTLPDPRRPLPRQPTDREQPLPAAGRTVLPLRVSTP